MTNPQRYSVGQYPDDAAIEEDDEGEYVLWEDYERLRKERDNWGLLHDMHCDLTGRPGLEALPALRVGAEAQRVRTAEHPNVHPVDALQDMAELVGTFLSPKREVQLRAICDEVVCGACGQPIQPARTI